MRQAVADYWWGREDGKRKVHWRSWEWLSTPKSLGGLGFRDFSLFNQAMLGKQSWRLLTEPNSLCARVLKGRYFPHCDFWDAPKLRSSSYTWRSILFGQELVKAGIRWGIANGQKVNIMTYPWIPERPPHLLQTLSPIPDNAKVCCLMDGHGHWNEENVRALISFRKRLHNSFYKPKLVAMLEMILCIGRTLALDCIPYVRHTIWLDLWISFQHKVWLGVAYHQIWKLRRNIGRQSGQLRFPKR
jgi:hypothetical protein